MGDWLSHNLGTALSVLVLGAGLVATWIRNEQKVSVLEKRFDEHDRDTKPLRTTLTVVERKVEEHDRRLQETAERAARERGELMALLHSMQQRIHEMSEVLYRMAGERGH